MLLTGQRKKSRWFISGSLASGITTSAFGSGIAQGIQAPEFPPALILQPSLAGLSSALERLLGWSSLLLRAASAHSAGSWRQWAGGSSDRDSMEPVPLNRLARRIALPHQPAGLQGAAGRGRRFAVDASAAGGTMALETK